MSKIKIQCTEEQLKFLVKSIVDNVNMHEIVKTFEDVEFKYYLSHEQVIEELIKDAFERTDPLKWRAEEGGWYWAVSYSGDVEKLTDCYYTMDNILYERGNYFETREKAEQYARKWRELFSGGGEK